MYRLPQHVLIISAVHWEQKKKKRMSDRWALNITYISSPAGEMILRQVSYERTYLKYLPRPNVLLLPPLEFDHFIDHLTSHIIHYILPQASCISFRLARTMYYITTTQ
jgi:hypothetical protein